MQPIYNYIVPYRGQKDYNEMNRWLISHMKAIDEIKENSFNIVNNTNKCISKINSSAMNICSHIETIENKINSIYKKILIERS